MTEQTTSKPWYKKWWGVILTIALFPFVVPYLVWTKTTWNKWVKIAITTFCAIIVISSMIDSSQRKQESLDLVNQAEIFISENKISEALTALDKSQELNTVKSDNPAFELEEKITKLKSAEFLKETLADMSDSDFDLLQKGELKASFIDHGEINKLFLAKLKENADQRAAYIAEAEELRKKEQSKTDNNEKSVEANKTEVAPTTKEEKVETIDVQPKSTKEVSIPVEYKSALKKAEMYAKTMHMSKQGIYDQLVSEYGEKFSIKAGQYAINNMKADWNKNALIKAKTYQNAMSMSPAAIHDQLTSKYGEKFTKSEADYAIQNLNN